MSKPRKKKRAPKRILALPDLEQSKAAVLNSLTSKSGQRSYDRAITDFVEWYCSEPRLSFNQTIVLRYRIFLEQKRYAPTTINLRLAALRRVALKRRIQGCSARNWPPAFEAKTTATKSGTVTFRISRSWLNRRPRSAACCSSFVNTTAC